MYTLARKYISSDSELSRLFCPASHLVCGFLKKMSEVLLKIFAISRSALSWPVRKFRISASSHPGQNAINQNKDRFTFALLVFALFLGFKTSEQ